jgi:hypothetical protein
VYFFGDFPLREPLMASFNILMFANGLWHVVWCWFGEKGKNYVPGLVTAPLHILTFLLYYSLIFR